jgi:hypothetical protein
MKNAVEKGKKKLMDFKKKFIVNIENMLYKNKKQ